MNPKHILIILAVMLLAGSCGSKKSLYEINVQRAPVTTPMHGYYYFLPRTVISVDIAVTRTTQQPGPFAQYAESLLGLQQVIKTPSVHYAITEISINSYAEPDPEHLYFIEFDSQNSSLFITLSETGLIQSVNRPFDSGEFMKNLGESKEYGHFGTDATFNYFIDINLQERIDTIMERVRLDTITVERATLRRSWVEKSADVRAKEVADYILKIRDEKFKLISGFAEVTYSRETIEYMYNELSRKENDYLALFTGISSPGTIRYRYTFTPERSRPDAPALLCYFSTREGILNQGVPGSVPVSIQVRQSPAAPMVANKMQQVQPARPGKKGLFYRIPEYSNVVISVGEVPRAEARILVNQYGHVSSLPPHELEVEYYPNTGSLKHVGITRQEDDDDD